MNGFRYFHFRVDPGLDDFHDEQGILGDHLLVGDTALKVCVALIDHRHCDLRCLGGCEMKHLELIYICPGGIAATDDFFSDIHRRNVDDTFIGRI